MAILSKFPGGSSAGLNFDVVAYESELLLPTTARENTIAVITETPITGWSFAASTPASPYEGMIWFSTANVTTQSFNAVKKNELLVYPNKASQYVTGTWVKKEAKLYTGGAWINISYGDKVYIIKDGKLNTPFVQSLTKYGTGNVAYNTDNICVYTTSSGQYAQAVTNTALPTAEFNTLKLDVSSDSRISEDASCELVSVASSRLTVNGSFSRTIKSLDISNITSDSSISFWARSWAYSNNYSRNYFYNAWLE